MEIKKIIIPVIITVVLVVILLSQIKIKHIFTTISTISPEWILVGFVLYIFSYFLRALRFNILLDGKVSVKDLFAIVSVHNMVNNILPARTGELSYVYLLKKTKSVPVGEGIATLMIARIFDFIVISMLFFVSVMNIKELPVVISNILLIIAAFLVLLVLILISLAYHGNKFMGIIDKTAIRLNLDKINVVNFLIKKGKETTESFGIIQSRKVILYCFLFSILVWGFNYLLAYILLNGMNISLVFWKVIVGSTLSVFTTILPIQSMGGLGVYEGAWAIGFMSLGISKEVAIASGFGIHIILFIYFLILGSIGMLKIKRMSNK